MDDPVKLVQRYSDSLSQIIGLLEDQKKSGLKEQLLPYVISALIFIGTIYASYMVTTYRVNEVFTIISDCKTKISLLEEADHKAELSRLEHTHNIKELRDYADRLNKKIERMRNAK